MSPSQRVVFGLVLVSVVACQQQQAGPPSRPVPETVSDGYGERPRDAAGGVQSASFDPGTNQPQVSRVEELLIGKFPSVDVQRTPNGNYSVTIRGTRSFMASEQALFVVDGMAVEQGRGLAWLAPADVTRIDLLRNPAETAIYGVRGGNGVIVITTKRKR